MSQFSIDFYVQRAHSAVQEDDSVFIDFYDPNDANNPFCARNFVFRRFFESADVEKAFSEISLKWYAFYPGEPFSYAYVPFDGSRPRMRSVVTGWWKTVEDAVSWYVSGSPFLRELSGIQFRRSAPRRDAYCVLSGSTAAGCFESRFQVCLFRYGEPTVCFCAFRFGAAV